MTVFSRNGSKGRMEGWGGNKEKNDGEWRDRGRTEGWGGNKEKKEG